MSKRVGHVVAGVVVYLCHFMHGLGEIKYGLIATGAPLQGDVRSHPCYRRIVNRHETETYLHEPVTRNKISHVGSQVTQWEFQKKQLVPK